MYADCPEAKQGRTYANFVCSAVGKPTNQKREEKTVALYSVSIKPISRSSGRSATAAAAYRNAERILDKRTGLVHDYSRRSGVDHVESFAPAGLAPQSSTELWNKAEAAETRSNARVAREVLVALPHELDQEQRRDLARSIAQDLANRYGVAGSFAVHAPDREGDQRNHHVHILMTTRRLESSGQLGEKTRELDDLKQGPVEVEWVRTMVEDQTNNLLDYVGLSCSVDRRSLADQHLAAICAGDYERAEELNRPATIHEGPRVTQIRREAARHGRMPLGALNRAAANDESRQLVENRRALAQVTAQVIDLEKARAARALGQSMAQDGMAAFRARFDQKQAIEAGIEAERKRLLKEHHDREVARLAEERAIRTGYELNRQREARHEAEHPNQKKRKVPEHSYRPPSPDRNGPDFSM